MSLQEQELLQNMMTEMTDIVMRCRKMYMAYSDYMMNAYKDNPTKRPTLLAKITTFESEADAICVTIKARRAYLSKSGKKKSDELTAEPMEVGVASTASASPSVVATVAPSVVTADANNAEPEKPLVPSTKKEKTKKTDLVTTDAAKPPPKKEKKSKKTDEDEPGQKDQPVLTTQTTAAQPAVSSPVQAPAEVPTPIAEQPPAEQKEEQQPIHVRRKKIPKHIKTLVWNQHIGNGISQGKCKCCMEEIINNRDFHCGHVIAESKGGDLTIPNLRPICAACNASMGTQSMNEFTKTFFGREI
jgi:hypothetical protein